MRISKTALDIARHIGRIEEHLLNQPNDDRLLSRKRIGNGNWNLSSIWQASNFWWPIQESPLHQCRSQIHSLRNLDSNRYGLC